MKSAILTNRCTHRTAAGRQCRRLTSGSQSALCAHHRSIQKQKESSDFSAELLSNAESFQTAQGVNFALSDLYELLAANRISARRAAVLAYINSLLLRTLPAIDAESDQSGAQPVVFRDWSNGGPNGSSTTATSTPEPANEAQSGSEAQSDSQSKFDSKAKSDSPERNAKPSAPASSDASTNHDHAPPGKYRSYWATIPDTTKKPS